MRQNKWLKKGQEKYNGEGGPWRCGVDVGVLYI
jgi:hypothetical protein